jgi:flagella basal body P-ring formation protein FlgA
VTQPLRQVATQPEDVIGKHARRLAGNAPLSTQDVTTVAVVHRGDMVRIVSSRFDQSEYSRRSAEAGKPGDTIRVKNTLSHREVQAQVIDKQTVRIRCGTLYHLPLQPCLLFTLVLSTLFAAGQP